MRFFRILTSVICLLAAASAAEIKIKVVDPQSAVVAGAQVVLIPQGSTTPAAVAATSAEGVVVFRGVASSPYHVQVLAPGFAPETTDLSPSAEMVTVKLRVATAAETGKLRVDLVKIHPVTPIVGAIRAEIEPAPGKYLGYDLRDLPDPVILSVVPDIEHLIVHRLAGCIEGASHGVTNVQHMYQRAPRRAVADHLDFLRRPRKTRQVIQHDVEPHPR